MRRAAKLAKLIGGWKSSKVYVDGEEKNWPNVFSFAWCYHQREASYEPTLYCFGQEQNRLTIWGCLHAHSWFSKYDDCWKWGRWLSKDGEWEFDKERFRHELRRRLYNYLYCPALDFGLVEEVIGALPERVNPWREQDWEAVQGYEETPGCRVSAPDDGRRVRALVFGGESACYYVGVAPRGLQTLASLGRRLKSRKLPTGVENISP
jgi:hypothetical protein